MLSEPSISLFFYWLRSNCRVWYGVSEILVAAALMYVAYSPRGGAILLTAGYVAPPLPTPLDRLIVGAVPFFASVYAAMYQPL